MIQILHLNSKYKGKLETELKWILFWQSHFPLGFNHNIHVCQTYNNFKMPDFDVRNVKLYLMVNEEQQCENCAKKALVLL